MFSPLCFCPERYFLLPMLWMLGKGRLGICNAHMLKLYSTQKMSAHRYALGHFICCGDGKAFAIPVNHTLHQTCTHTLTDPTAQCWLLILAYTCSSATAVLSALFSPASLFCSTTPHPPTSLHHLHYTSSPFKSPSFLLLITVVGPFELFKAARAARKDPQCSQKRWSVCGGGGGKEGEGRRRQIRFCWHGHSVHGPEALVKLLFPLSHCLYHPDTCWEVKYTDLHMHTCFI